MKGKKINCLGDSITWGHGNAGVSWVDFLQEEMTETEIRKYGVCGSMICPTPDRQDSFLERMKEMGMDYDVCILFGGVNDFNHGNPLGTAESRGIDTFYGAYREMIEFLLTRNPKGELICITPMKTRDFKGYPHWNSENATGKKLNDYRNAVMELAEEYSIPVLDLFTVSGISADLPQVKQYIQADGLHPTREGYLRMCRKIFRFLNYQF